MPKERLLNNTPHSSIVYTVTKAFLSARVLFDKADHKLKGSFRAYIDLLRQYLTIIPR